MTNNVRSSDAFAGEGKAAQEGGNLSLLAVFNFLQFFGFLSVAIVVVTAWLSPRIYRTSTWYSFMGSWMFFCLSFFIIVGQQVGAEPDFGVCLTQAALIYSAAPLTSWGSLVFLLQLYFNVSAVLENGKPSRSQKIGLHLIPFAVHLVVFLEALIIGLLNRDQVSRDPSGMYCHLQHPLQYKISAAVVILAMILMLIYEGLIANVLYRNWNAFQKLRVHSPNAAPLPLMIRMIVFSFLPMFAIAMAISANFYFPNQESFTKIHLVIASLPAAAAFIFGTQHDILSVWMFWKKPETGSHKSWDSAV
ncbi:hypothetical protein C8J57DRAFT_1290202 [Mycena rebaudengoi]|nr:hypothetical protein C8J57DRAFT_1290202 [Mycena rebaudengoi]